MAKVTVNLPKPWDELTEVEKEEVYKYATYAVINGEDTLNAEYVLGHSGDN